MSVRRLLAFPLLLTLILPAATLLAEDEPQFFEPPAEEGFWDGIRFSGWAEMGWRDSGDHRVVVPAHEDFPFAIVQEAVDPGRSLEVSNVALQLEADLAENVVAHVKLDLIDLYDRNPTSTDSVIDVDEVWVRFGRKFESRQLAPGSTIYLLAGKAPKFEKQLIRSSVGYGLVSTAFNRMEDLQLQLGGSLGRHVYWRAQVSQGNPLFMRDPGLLAGDNGTWEAGDLTGTPDLGSGFPILYDAEVEWVDPGDAEPELGAGAGVRFGSEDGWWGLDLLGFWYQRDLADERHLHGTFYLGDIGVLNAGPTAFELDGRRRTETGANLDLRVGDVSLFGQWVAQDLAGLERDGVETELAWRRSLAPRFAVGGQQLFTFLQAAVRWSRLENDFGPVPGFPAPSFWWDWEKLDVAVRLGLLGETDLTVEWSRQDVEAKVPFEIDEVLATLHVGF